MRHAAFLRNLGYGILLIDCREHGTSDPGALPRGVSFGSRESHDVLVSAAYIKTKLGYRKVVALGTSQGATSSIIAASRPDAQIDIVIAENPFGSRRDLLNHIFDKWTLGSTIALLKPFQRLLRWFCVSAAVWLVVHGDTDHSYSIEEIEAVKDIAPRPILFMHSTNDLVVPHQQSINLYEAASQPKELWICDHASHTGIYDQHPDEFERRSVACPTTAPCSHTVTESSRSLTSLPSERMPQLIHAGGIRIQV